MIKRITNIIYDFYHSNRNACRMIHFDIETQELFFQLRMKSSICKILLIDAVNHPRLIQMLSPVEACWLGGYYGRYSRAQLQNKRLKQEKTHFSYTLKNSDSRYQIISLNRENQLTYFDQHQKQNHTQFPHLLATDYKTISLFDNLSYIKL